MQSEIKKLKPQSLRQLLLKALFWSLTTKNKTARCHNSRSRNKFAGLQPFAGAAGFAITLSAFLKGDSSNPT
jgi:hypothetical protein